MPTVDTEVCKSAKIDEVTEALRNALTEGYKQRYTYLAVASRSSGALSGGLLTASKNTASPLVD